MSDAEEDISDGYWYVRAISDISVGSFGAEGERDTADGGACAPRRRHRPSSMNGCNTADGGGSSLSTGGQQVGSPKMRGMRISWATDYDSARASPPEGSETSSESSPDLPPAEAHPNSARAMRTLKLGDPADRAYARTLTAASDAMSVGTAGTADATESEDSEEDEGGRSCRVHEGVERKSEIWEAVSREDWHSQTLSVVVVGASGDLAKKKTYPSLLALFASGLLPPDTAIWGYARSGKTSEEFREHLRPYLIKSSSGGKKGGRTAASKVVDEFLSRCYYHSGKSYGDVPSYEVLVEHLRDHESDVNAAAVGRPKLNGGHHDGLACNRLFYLAVPPNVFGDTAAAVRATAMEHETANPAGGSNEGGGWVRLVVEKPFGRDLPTCLSLSSELSSHFDEHHLYRIDHYLGKEMVQNLTTFRFGNDWVQHLWHAGAIQSVLVEFKEPFGTEGRGGYFDKYGIIRDVIQNHLLQVLTLLAMEPPPEDEGEGDEEGEASSAERIRDAKVAVLSSVPPVSLGDVVLGQYDGYADDPTIADKETNCPTYAAVRLAVNTPRWEGVPFLLTAGKALDERVCQVRIRFKPPPGRFAGRKGASELTLKLQPGESISLSTQIKSPGFGSSPTSSSLDLNYASSFANAGSQGGNPDAYTRLLLDVLRGNRAPFVRDDELTRSWEIFTPLLHAIERHGEGARPFRYEMGGQGPEEAQRFVRRVMDGGEEESAKERTKKEKAVRLEYPSMSETRQPQTSAL